MDVNAADSSSSQQALDPYSRYRFQDHDFLPQWKALQKFVKYRSIGDYVYGARHFTSARHLQESLDKAAIPALYSMFQPNEVIPVSSEDHDLVKLRKLVCAELLGTVADDSECNAGEGPSLVDDDDPSSTGDNQEEITEWNPPKMSFRSSQRSRSADNNKRSAISYDAGTDQYLKKKKRKLSRTSSDGAFPSLEKTIAHAKRLDTSNAERIEADYAKNEFPRWKFLLYSMHSLILYGNGSKRTIVSEFCDNELQSDGAILQVDGIDTNVSVESITNLLAELFRGQMSSKLTAIENVRNVGQTIQKSCEESKDAVFLILFNLDSILQRNPADWPAILTLSKYVRILATVDDVDAPSLMMSSNISSSSFVWIALHTQRPYVRELAKIEFLDEGKGRQSIRSRQRELSESRILEVLRNLAPRYAEVMQVLARLQMNIQGDDDDIGGGWVNYKDFREECKNNFLIDKDSKLRSLQTELKDHGLMVDKLDATGEFVLIPYAASKLQAIQNFKVKLSR